MYKIIITFFCDCGTIARPQNLDSSGEVRSFINACQDWDPSPYLSCRYYRGDDKFLTIAPLREETVALIPDIKLYHDVLCDDEITKIKTLAKKKVKYNRRVTMQTVLFPFLSILSYTSFLIWLRLVFGR